MVAVSVSGSVEGLGSVTGRGYSTVLDRFDPFGPGISSPANQVRGTAGDYQVKGARVAQLLSGFPLTTLRARW